METELKFHTVYRFEQSPWLANYIEYNTEQRSQAKNGFEKRFHKLIKNFSREKHRKN